MRARVFLKGPLFTFAGHVPRGAAVVEGVVKDTGGFGLTVAVEGYLDEGGKRLEGPALTLILPAAKVDHVLVLG
ncbi:MAG: hypothetical protein FJ102_19420 [Deltaproteobacteria bacterium]|nr:hypothetical protein [Deltaproteobacteria bacterium]